MLNKRGQILLEHIMFIVLNLIFFTAMFAFVSVRSNSNALYAEAFAKQVALLIDHSSPNMKIMLDLSDFYKNIKKGNIEIDPTAGEVIISEENEKDKNSRKELFRHQFFADYSVNYRLEQNTLFMEVTPNVPNIPNV